MSLGHAGHQKPWQPGRSARGEGQAGTEAFRDEAGLARHEPEGSGRVGLLEQALVRGNLVVAWKRVRANGGSAGRMG
jgi:RNA-directed DNA polymerase